MPEEKPNRFYAIATGQAQANLPCIFSLAGQGDTVVWIVTPLAEQRHWSDSSRIVLDGRGIMSVELRVTDADILNPDRFKNILVNDIGGNPNSNPTFIATGGTKYMTLGIDRAAVELGIPIAYSDMQPAALLTLTQPSGAFTSKPLTNPITLHEWLIVNGFQLHSRNYIEIWPNPSPGAQLDPSRDVAFLTDPAVQRTFLAKHYAKVKNIEQEARQPLPIHIPDEYTGTPLFREAWRKLLDFIGPCRHPNSNHIRKLQNFLSEQAKAAAKARRPPVPLDPVCLQQLETDGWTAAGDRFEQAVALRVRQFLVQHPAIAAIVSGVYLNLEISSPRHPSDSFTELDIAILLHNATVIHLECKCGRTTSEAETYQRLGKLQYAGKSAATLVFTIPMFPELAGGPEFQYLYEPYRNIVRHQSINPSLRLLFFTNPNQTGTVQCQYKDDPPFDVIPFEQGLATLLGHYVDERHAVALGAR